MLNLQALDTDTASSPGVMRYEDFRLIPNIRHAFDYSAAGVVPTELFGLISVGVSKGFELSHRDSGNWEFRDRALIYEFEGEPYRVKILILVDIRIVDPSQVEASFREANVTWVDDGRAEALSGLKAEILNTFEDYEAHEDQLGPEPHRQLDVLRNYIESTIL